MDAVGLKLALAYGLDLIFGDPRWLPHPVRGLGWAIQKGEAFLRARIRNEEWAGWVLVLGIGLGTWLLVDGILRAVWRISAGWAFGGEVALLYVCLSTKDLAVESWPVYRALKGKDLPRARADVSLIVGRDTQNLSEAEVVRATVETIGESAMDGIIAPLFYAAIGGAPLACLYKAVNTLDSMVGYRSARYLRFGKAAAKVDTWMNYVPARITAWIISLAASWVGFSCRGGLKAVHRDAWKRGQNSWIPEAAFAGALGVQLGGTNFYNGVADKTPSLGDGGKPLEPEVIPKAIRLMYACSILGAILAIGIRWSLVSAG